MDPRSVRNSNGGYVVEEADGTPRVYGDKSPKAQLGYLGVLHPKLSGTVLHGSESKAMIGDREATSDETLYRHDVEYFGYATVELKGTGESYTVTTDSKGNPVDKPVWDSIDAAAPREIFEDSSLRAAIANSGVIKD